ncbi:TonB-dependent receptor [Bacteroides caccae]|uniref:TonB-dependent receptor n=1 Tax=Bacteroides caccae TaxID=47678 RepID=A0AAW7WMA8_9BACE|nr:TonB-dependent receptor [Bacteroides caccae]MDO6326917.1 TonB-dependent receptor [Bacteroides caccae]MDO6340117.1 TonB-dependent receptor [Bacteroides caccae]MDO6357186.1 TonB-dependent receptor [Bacteroides caccae]
MKKKYSLFTLLVGTCLCSLSAYAVPTDIATPITQEINQKSKKQIKGTVLDENEEPVIGATVVVIGVAGGGITDMDGKFTLSAFPNQELEVSYLGYQNARIKVTDKSTYVIRMKPKIDELEEVTVVAFAKQKKESVIASVSTIKPAELKVPSSNLTTALAGRMSGIISYQTSGEPGKDNAQFFVRGVTTFEGETRANPLILIDGIEMGTDDLARLQTDDIASFSVMKDATAAALYGSRGANGVILVSTKQGSEGKAKVSIRYELAMSRPTRTVDLADPITYMKLHNEAVRTRDPLGALPYSEEKIASTAAGLNPQVYPAIDWKEMLFKDQAINHRFNFNISGGGKVARYYLSGSYSKDSGLLQVNGKNSFNNNISLQRMIMRATVNINMTKSTEVVVRMYGTFDDYTGPLKDGSKFYEMVMNTNPVMFQPVYQPDERYKNAPNILFGNAGTNADYTNPYAELVKGYKDYSATTIVAQVELKQNLEFITKGLNARVLANTNRYSYFDVSRQYVPFFYRLDSYDKFTNTYQLSALNEDKGSEALQYTEGPKTINTSYYLEAAVDYNRVFNEKHTVTGLLVGTMREYKEANAGSLLLSLPHRNIGLAGRATYSYDSRYFGELNFGYNGSERFAKKNRWGFFPSIGAGYIISNEHFYPESWKKVMNKLKLKATYGLVGNDAIGNTKDRFFYLSNVNVADAGKNIAFGTDLSYSHPGGGVSFVRYPNEDISWETAYKTDFGVEIGLFDRVEIIADYFSERRKNILMTRAHVPSFIGLQTNPSANVGEAKSHGFEASVDYNHSFSNGMWLMVRGNFTYATSEYSKYEEPDYSDAPWRRREGNSLAQTWGYVAERLFVDEADVANSPVQSFDNQKAMAGDIKYKDINGDGQITETDMVPIGYPTSPEIIYGFGFSAGYKGFDLSCFFQGSARSSFWIDPENTAPFIGNQRTLLKAYADDHWSEENRNLYALWPRLSATKRTNNYQKSTWFMRDGSFLRLKSVEMGYTIPEKITKKAHISMLRFYLSGTNLLTFSKFKLWDVEMGGKGLGYPVQMVINAGVQLNF